LWGLILLDIRENSLPSTERKQVFLSAALAALAIASIALPIANVRVMGFSGGISLPSAALIGGVAYVLPLAFLAGLAGRFAAPLRPYMRAIEIAGLAFALGVAIYVIATLLGGMNDLNNANRQMSQMLGSANARQFSISGGVSLARGSVALLLLVAGSAWQVWTGRRR
jgi:hypothetical protein